MSQTYLQQFPNNSSFKEKKKLFTRGSLKMSSFMKFLEDSGILKSFQNHGNQSQRIIPIIGCSRRALQTSRATCKALKG